MVIAHRVPRIEFYKHQHQDIAYALQDTVAQAAMVSQGFVLCVIQGLNRQHQNRETVFAKQEQIVSSVILAQESVLSAKITIN